jgi:hypothetical protein
MAPCTADQLREVLQLLGGDVARAAEACAKFGNLGPQGAVIATLVSDLSRAKAQQEELAYGVDTSFTLSSAILVFLMQVCVCVWGGGGWGGGEPIPCE